MWRDLLDLVLPAPCPGCAGPGPLCPDCAAALAGPPRAVRPDPAPPTLPECVAFGEYAGPLRQLLLAYKERGRHGLATRLGARLAVGAAALAGTAPVVLVPVPATAAAIRARHGDHAVRLARRAAGTLRASGRPAVVVRALTARPRPDSAELTAAERAAAAPGAFPGRAPTPGAAADRPGHGGHGPADRRHRHHRVHPRGGRGSATV